MICKELILKYCWFRSSPTAYFGDHSTVTLEFGRELRNTDDVGLWDGGFWPHLDVIKIIFSETS